MTQTSQSSTPPGALSHLRVLELGGLPAAAAGRFLADLSADVIKVEPPGGDSLRFQGPFAGDIEDPDRSLSFLAYNENKRSVALDLTADSDKESLLALARTADILVEAYPPGYLTDLGLGYDRLRDMNPNIIVVSITPFGQTGPLRDFKGNSAIIEAMGGIMFIQGDDTLPPCASPCDQYYQLSGMHAAVSALMATRHRRVGGTGQHIDISMQEVVSFSLPSTVARYTHRLDIVRREGVNSRAAGNIYPTQDGHIHMMPALPRQWTAMVSDWMQHPVLSEPEWEDPQYRQQNFDLIDALWQEFTAGFTVEGFMEGAQSRGIPSGPVNKPRAFAESAHMRERGYFVERDHPIVGRYQSVGYPFRMSATPMRFNRPAPRLGEHQDQVLQEARQAAQSAPTPPQSESTAETRKPLDGVRVLDFTRVIAGPVGTMLLGFYGADVIKIESTDLPAFRGPGQPGFPDMNRAKRSVTIDARKDEGKELIKDLVRHSDVVTENFGAHVMANLGLDYEDLRKVKPDIIMVSMPGMGNAGPLSNWRTYGQNLQGYTGLMYLWGYEGSPIEARPKIPHADYVGAAAQALAILSALEQRNQTGTGQFIEIAQVEALGSLLGPAYLDYFVNGREWGPQGYTTSANAPHGCYPCRGDDAWCVISCETEEEWRALVEVLGDPTWAMDEKFSTRESRRANQAELDRHLQEWTRAFTPHQVMLLLQRAGVPAGAVQNGENVYGDAHLRSRGQIVEVAHPADPWVLSHSGLPAIFSATPGDATGPAPLMGDANGDVFPEILGLDAETMESLQAAKVIY